ncbi:MAG TPA: recombinase family protein [Clostridia bacterium]
MLGRKFGYKRVSDKEQNEDRQIIAMKENNIDDGLIFIEKQSGKDFSRPQYQLLKRIMQNGDILYIKSLDRFGRNKQQILDEWHELTKVKGIEIIVLDMPLLDTTKFKDLNGLETLIQDIVLQVLSWLAEDERKRIRERQREGIDAAKMKGKYLGRPKVCFPDNFEKFYAQWKNGNITATQCIKDLNLKRTSFYKLVKQYENEKITSKLI